MSEAVRDFVVDYLHYTGQHRDLLTERQQWEMYCLADGYGNLTPEALSEINDGWDWSHIRDSSADAFARMAARLKEWGFTPSGRLPVKPE